MTSYCASWANRLTWSWSAGRIVAFSCSSPLSNRFPYIYPCNAKRVWSAPSGYPIRTAGQHRGCRLHDGLAAMAGARARDTMSSSTPRRRAELLTMTRHCSTTKACPTWIWKPECADSGTHFDNQHPTPEAKRHQEAKRCQGGPRVVHSSVNVGRRQSAGATLSPIVLGGAPLTVATRTA